MAFIKSTDKILLKPLVDAMIPAYEDMPAASDADLLEIHAERVLELRQDLRDPFRRAMRALKDIGDKTPEEFLVDIQKDDQEAYVALSTIVAGGYMFSEEVCSKYSYPGMAPTEWEAEEIPYYVRNGLLNPVIERGPIYQPVSS